MRERLQRERAPRALKSKVWSVMVKLEVEEKFTSPDGNEVTRRVYKIQCKLCKKYVIALHNNDVNLVVGLSSKVATTLQTFGTMCLQITQRSFV